jgi:hypothetical protein
MGQRFKITEEEAKNIRKLYFTEEKKDEKLFCHSGNVKKLEDVIGPDDYEDFITGVKIRKNGVNGIVDRLELLKTLRLYPSISDGGENLALQIVDQLKGFKPYNYFDEIKKECCKVMDKIIELYKENEHGEDLVNDIQKVYAMSSLSPRAKEFLKHGIEIVKTR